MAAPRQQGGGDRPGRVALHELLLFLVPPFPVDQPVQAIQQVVHVQIEDDDCATGAGDASHRFGVARDPAHQLPSALVEIRLVLAQYHLRRVHVFG